MMVESLLEYSTLGYVLIAEDPSCGNPRYSESTAVPQCTELNVYRALSRRRWKINTQEAQYRLRRVSLKCLVSILRGSDVSSQVEWWWLVSDRSSRPGLATIAIMDSCKLARRFGFYCVVSILRSIKRSFRGSFIPADAKSCSIIILEVLLCLLRSNSSHDRETAEHALMDIIACIPWKSLNEKGRMIQTLYEIILTGMKERGEGELRLDALTALATISEIDESLQKGTISWVLEIYSSGPPDVPKFVFQINSLLSKIGDTMAWDHGMEKVIADGIHIVAQASGDNLLGSRAKNHFAGCLTNIAKLNVIEETLFEDLNRIALNIRGSLADDFFVGLGRLSRKSSKCSDQILKLNLIDVVQVSLTPGVIRGSGDILFSGIMFGSNSAQLPMLVKALTRWDLSTRGLCLRAFMTGLSRLRDEPQDRKHNITLNTITQSIKRFLIALWAEGLQQCDERLSADSVRSIGLIACNGGLEDDFKIAAKDTLCYAILSGKTQRVLAALASLGSFEVSEDSQFCSLVRDMVSDWIESLNDRKSWDYDSADSINGALHVIREGVLYLKKVSSYRLNEVPLQRFVTISTSVRKYKVFKYNPNILVHLERIQAMIP
jgi:hypothetical protein